MKQLKAADLMPMDIVRHKRTKEIISIFEIDEYRNVINNEADGYCSETNISIDDIEPIIVSESILEQNEFVHDSLITGDSWDTRRWIYKKDEFTIKIQYPTDNFTGCCVISVNKGSFITYIFGKEIYAHELQHCLRLCGLNKLADNLKIE